MRLILFLSCLQLISGELLVAKFFSSHMVLQEAPHVANIYGTFTFAVGPITAEVSCQSGASYEYEAQISTAESAWLVTLDPIHSGERCDISITDLVDVVTLEDVLFGDVWICSGQSNMGWSLSAIEGGPDLVEEASNHTNIRMYKIERATSEIPVDDILEERMGWTRWNDGADDWPEDTPWEKPGHKKKPVADFSAICYLFAKEISEHLGNKPLGLIASAYAGTRIEAWLQKEALEACHIEDHVEEGHPFNSNSYIYNAMIHPLQKMSIKGMVWYQGEANTFWNTDKYKCTLHQMIKTYRKTWNEKSDTQAHFPTGIIQLAALANPPTTRTNDGEHFPLIRWHQTLNQGFLPNKHDYNMFMGLALDTYYNGSVHSHYKQLPAKRLAIAGLNVAYKMREFPANGPFPENFQVRKSGPITQVEITYDETPIAYSPGENSGFFLCCGANNSSNCNGDDVNPASDWKVLPISAVTQTSDNSITVNVDSCNGPSSLGYLWAESPVVTLHGLPIYSTDQYGLPAAPWWKFT